PGKKDISAATATASARAGTRDERTILLTIERRTGGNPVAAIKSGWDHSTPTSADTAKVIASDFSTALKAFAAHIVTPATTRVALMHTAVTRVPHSGSATATDLRWHAKTSKRARSLIPVPAAVTTTETTGIGASMATNTLTKSPTQMDIAKATKPVMADI